jgi:hypothetical protein
MMTTVIMAAKHAPVKAGGEPSTSVLAAIKAMDGRVKPDHDDR